MWEDSSPMAGSLSQSRVSLEPASALWQSRASEEVAKDLPLPVFTADEAANETVPPEVIFNDSRSKEYRKAVGEHFDTH